MSIEIAFTLIWIIWAAFVVGFSSLMIESFKNFERLDLSKKVQTICIAIILACALAAAAGLIDLARSDFLSFREGVIK